MKNKIKNLLEKLTKIKENEKRVIKKIEKNYKISICSIKFNHWILEKINKKIKMYIQVELYSDIQELSICIYGKNWFRGYEVYNTYTYIIINDIMFYYI